jgi:uncharacterized membrane protein
MTSYTVINVYNTAGDSHEIIFALYCIMVLLVLLVLILARATQHIIDYCQ